MKSQHSMVYSALLLTAVGLLLRLVSMGFQVYLSGLVGAAGIGLLQLVLSVNVLVMTAGMGGVRTTSMYLSAGELGRSRPERAGAALSACFIYSILLSTATALCVWSLAPQIALRWIGDARATDALRIFAAFLPVCCLGGVMTGYFTAAGRIRELAAVEVAEQLCAMGATVLLLTQWARGDLARSCCAVVGGGSCAAAVTLACLMFLYRRERRTVPSRPAGPMTRRLLSMAVPLALADDLRMGLGTVENLIIPRRLAAFPGSRDPMADYGIICGMVFPVLMFPAAILYALAELLVPELSRCAAGRRERRIRYLTGRSLRTAFLYSLAAAGLLFTAARPLGRLLYSSEEAGRCLRMFAPLVPMLYTDAVTDAMTKGMGQQQACVRYNTITSFLDVVFLWTLLPLLGIRGYYLSFTVTHLINFGLSLRRLCRTTGWKPRLQEPARAILGSLAAVWMASLLPEQSGLSGILLRGGGFLAVWSLGLILLGVLDRRDLQWLRSLLRRT